MMRSLYSGVSGLQNHQTRMDVIGNNISNINTTGFKKGRVTFQDMLYQQLSAASRPNDEVGGVNPKEVGLGMTIASIDTIHTQGSLQTTGVNTDLAISGSGFFILKDGLNAVYTRAGNFTVDQNGTFVNPSNGMKVQGWMALEIDGVQILDTSRDTEDLIIPIGGKDPARATTSVNFACNLDKRTPFIGEGAGEAEIRQGTWGTEITIFDNFGDAHTLRVEFSRIPGEDNPNSSNAWNATVTVDPQNPNPTNPAVGFGAVGEGNTFTVNFSNLGNLASVVDAAGNTSPDAGAVLMRVGFDVQNATPGADGVIRQEFDLNLGTVGGLVNSITQYAEGSTTKAFTQDGYTMGYLENFKIDQSGGITGIYTNGTNRILGQIALASFANQGGLEKAGDNNYAATNNSGIANVGASNTQGKGKIISGTLEMSNVDMAEQFTDMIVTQRGFQANTRTIQTADQLLQELLTLKR
ncbi:flagellar hook protein FlgE [Spirochaetia bacterium]|nr:flagellar hook protein FlgE [Spirochaetia bacterium]